MQLFLTNDAADENQYNLTVNLKFYRMTTASEWDVVEGWTF